MWPHFHRWIGVKHRSLPVWVFRSGMDNDQTTLQSYRKGLALLGAQRVGSALCWPIGVYFLLKWRESSLIDRGDSGDSMGFLNAKLYTKMVGFMTCGFFFFFNKLKHQKENKKNTQLAWGVSEGKGGNEGMSDPRPSVSRHTRRVAYTSPMHINTLTECSR